MNNRIRKHSRRWAGLFCAASVLGALGACSEDYELDEKNPDWLGTNIYEVLTNRSDFKNFVHLIDDLGYTEVLGKTGSKTLFVANDSAFDAFYKDNAWGVSCYEELTTAQKKLLLNSAMINNAYLIEMMSSLEGPIKGECLRRKTAADVTDSVPHFKADELPISYNTEDYDFWARFRDPQHGGIYLALDATTPMMTHFLSTQMSNEKITDDDFRIIVGQSRKKNDAYIFDSKILEQDITCQNGYINRLDKVLVPPQNMAEVLRTNGETNIFSHMIDRFSAPFYNDDLTKRYRLLYGNTVDSVFQKRYFSLRSQGNAALDNSRGSDPVGDPNGKSMEKKQLIFDLGWNEYRTDAQTAVESDMGIIFAPSDQRFYDYFFNANGGGHFLLEAYAPMLMQEVGGPTDYENIYRAIDQIPLNVIKALINNLMKDSFNNSVPSKFETIKDDAQDPMLDETHLPMIKDVKLANNGAIFIMDEVLTPAIYASVSGPAFVATDMHIFNDAIQAQTLDIDCNYYAYLLAMSARFSFFVPQDEGFWYIDPVSFALKKGEQRALLFEYDAKNGIKCTPYAYNYDFVTGQGEIGNKLTNVKSDAINWKNRLRDMLETHTIVHANDSDFTLIDETQTGIECDKHWFLSKNGAPIYAVNAKGRANAADPCKVMGGWQLQHNDLCSVIRFDDKSGIESINGEYRKTGNGNGFAYEIDKPMSPTIESVYSVMYNTPEFQEFFNLCQTDDEVLTAIGIKSAADKKKYSIFINNTGLPAYDKATGNQVATATNVKFFNNYNYTVYIPENQYVRHAIDDLGLPTWQQMRDLLYLDNPNDKPEWTSEEEQAVYDKVTVMVNVLVNFIKNHFQDNSIYADMPALQEKKYETATLLLDDEGMPSIYAKVTIHSEGNGTLMVTDANGKTCQVTKKNIVTRDYVLDNASAPTKITASSSAVVHAINGILDYKKYAGGRYDSDFVTAKARKAYMRNYRILK